MFDSHVDYVNPLAYLRPAHTALISSGVGSVEGRSKVTNSRLETSELYVRVYLFCGSLGEVPSPLYSSAPFRPRPLYQNALKPL